MTEQDFISKIRDASANITSVRALFLAGSHGYGAADAYSDFDFVAVVEPGAQKNVAVKWRSLLDGIEPVVFWAERTGDGLLVNAITKSWVRCDLNIVAQSRLGQYAQDSIVPLVDRDGLFETLARTAEPPRVDLVKLRFLINEFLRVLGLVAVVVGREEYLVAISGVGLQRNHLIALMIEEKNPVHRGGALHLNRILNSEQKSVLAAIPTVKPTRDSVIEAHLAYADAFLPRARVMAAAHGIDWPEEFEAATWAVLERELGIDPRA